MKETLSVPAEMGRKNTFHWALIVLLVCFVDLFVNYSIRLGCGVILPEMIRDASGSYGGAFAINMLAAAVAFLLFCAVGKERELNKVRR
jgi:hypothetical protein